MYMYPLIWDATNMQFKVSYSLASYNLTSQSRWPADTIVHQHNNIIQQSVNRGYDSARTTIVHAMGFLAHVFNILENYHVSHPPSASQLFSMLMSNCDSGLFSYFWGIVHAEGANSSLPILPYNSKSLKPFSVVLYRCFVESYASKPFLIASSR